MYKFLFLFLLLFSSLYSKKLELLTGEFVREGNVTVAKGGVSIFGEGVFINSDEAVFDSKTNRLELFGNVIIKRENNTEAMVDYLSFNVESEDAILDNAFFPGGSTNIWLLADSGESSDKIYRLTNIVTSSCSPTSPDWSIKSTSGQYDFNGKWAHLYNPTFYAGRVPVFYLPYFGYSTDDRRRTGLLPPKFGTSNIDGTLFELPLFIAPYDSWDMEIWPQYRSDRGTGITSKFRFVDSASSSGEIVFGEFHDKDDYSKKYNIEDSTHSGLRIKYRRDNLFSNDGATDKLYINWEDYSDVDFLKLESVSSRDSGDLGQIITNEFNYYYNDKENFLGVYGRYFKDILNPNRKDLLQIYPDIQGHIFTDSFLIDSLLYSLDFRAKNYTREENTTAHAEFLSVPVSYSNTLFNDYLNYQISHNVDLYRIDYRNIESHIASDYGQRLSTYSRVTMSSGLSKALGNGFHGINFSLSYTLPGEENEQGILDSEFVTFSKESKGYDLLFSQYLYDQDYTNRLIQRINQGYRELDGIWEYTDLEHELIFKPKTNLTLKNSIKYSSEYDVVVSNYSSLLLNTDLTQLTLSYLTGNDRATREKDKDYYTFTAKSGFSKRHTFKGRYEYDNLDKEDRKISLSYLYKKDCWGVSLNFSREVEPVATATGTSSRINDIVFLKLNINPLGEHELQVFEDEK